MLIQVGSNETLLDDATRLAARAGAADVAVTLEIWPHMIHAWPLWNAHLEDGRRALASAGSFIRAQVAPSAQNAKLRALTKAEISALLNDWLRRLAEERQWPKAKSMPSARY